MNRERNINRMFIISGVIASILVISLIGVLIARSSSRGRENDFAEELSRLDASKLDSESVSTQIGNSIEESEEDEDFNDEEETEDTIAQNKTNTENATETQANTDTNTNATNTEKILVQKLKKRMKKIPSQQ